ncbi:hypothetical protein [Flagellimonas myxillae]|uniref:hypothetical protein n=1 Tax=Flagellimonas myxillae TaxID=2942214 RepID=UPI00201E8A9A|nr:hypothetical protein [Muricauda myxillae]MCL6264922.1 hypothetical protein [Muricauda myxillae]
MDLLEEAKFKDKILGLIVDKENGVGDLWLYHQLKEEDISREYLKEFLERFAKNHSDYITLTIGQEHHVRKSRLTKKMLDDGGFVKERERHIEANKSLVQSTLQGSRIKDLQETELKQKIRNNKFTLPIAITSIIISLGALGWSIFNPSKTVSESIDNNGLRNIEMKIQQLEDGLKREIDSLRNEILETNLLIKAYEADSTNA